MHVRVAMLVAVLVALAAPANAHISKKPNAQKAIAFLQMVFNQKEVKEGFDQYVGDKYIQHNPIAADGKQAAVEVLGKALQALPGWHYEVKHAYVDGDYAIIHSHVRMKPEDRGVRQGLSRSRQINRFHVDNPCPTPPLHASRAAPG